jgi:hypothetical protein
MTETPQEGPEPSQPATSEAGLFDAPKDVSEDIATGYAVYDRTLGRYFGPVSEKKPSKTDAGKQVAKGHTAAVVRV